MADGVEILCVAEDLFLCLGSDLGKDPNYEPTSEKGGGGGGGGVLVLPLANRCYLYLELQESVDHLLSIVSR